MTNQNTETTRRKVLKSTAGGLVGASTLAIGSAAAQGENIEITPVDVQTGESIDSITNGDTFGINIEWSGLQPHSEGQLYIESDYKWDEVEKAGKFTGQSGDGTMWVQSRDYEDYIQGGWFGRFIRLAAAADCRDLWDLNPDRHCNYTSNFVELDVTRW